MSSTSIGPELNNNKNEMKNLKLIMLNKNKLLFYNNQKLTKLKKIRILSPQRNRKIINMVHQSPQRKILTQLIKKINQGNFWLSKSTHILFPQNIILTQLRKHINQKHSQKQLILKETIKTTPLKKQIN